MRLLSPVAGTHTDMISVTRLEHACADAWPAQVDEPLGEWRLRAAGGFTGRANSALAVGDPGRDLPAALTAVCEFSHHHAISPLLQTVRGGPVEHALPALGWAPQDDRPAGGEVAVLLGPAVPPVPVPGHRVEVRAEPTPGWWELTVGRQQPTDAETRGPHRRRSGGVRAGHRPRRDPRGRAGSARRRPAVRGAARRAPATPAHGARNGPDGRYRHVGRTARRTGLRAAGLGRQPGRAPAL